MNKKLLAVAIAASFVAPAVMADTTVYGLIDTALVNTDTQGGSSVWDVENGNGTSRFGVKGTEDLGNGMKAIFQLEWAATTVDGGPNAGTGLDNRLSIVGLTGGFGTVAMGRQWTPYYFAVNKTNIFNIAGTNNASQAMSRTGNAVAYVTPNFSGFSAALAFVVDGADAGDDGADAMNLALKYDNGPLSVGFGYHDYDAGNLTQMGLGAKYKMDMFAVMGQIEKKEVSGAADVDSWNLAAEAYFGNNTLKVAYGEKDVNMDQFSIGLQHNFSKSTRAYVEYSTADNGAAADVDKFGIGLRHDF